MPSATTEVTVIVTDVNDETPRFRSERYIGEVLENAQQNTPITFLQDAIPEVFDYDQVKPFENFVLRTLKASFRVPEYLYIFRNPKAGYIYSLET